MVSPFSSCRHAWMFLTQSSESTSSSVARFFGLVFSMRPTMYRLSRGKIRRSRHGPLITSWRCPEFWDDVGTGGASLLVVRVGRSWGPLLVWLICLWAVSGERSPSLCEGSDLFASPFSFPFGFCSDPDWSEGPLERGVRRLLSWLWEGRSGVDLGRRRGSGSGTGVPGVGLETNNLYELSVMRGCFHGKRRKVIQQKMIASDQTSVGRGSYFFSS